MSFNRIVDRLICSACWDRCCSFLKIIFQIPENKLVDPNFVVIFSLLATVSLGGFIFTKTR